MIIAGGVAALAYGMYQAERTPQTAAAPRIRNPYGNAQTWLRCQLHCHSTGSPDGLLPAGEMERVYRQAGFDVVVVTDDMRDGSLRMTGERLRGKLHTLWIAGREIALCHPHYSGLKAVALIDAAVGIPTVEVWDAAVGHLGMSDSTAEFDYLLAHGQMVAPVAIDDWHGTDDGPYGAATYVSAADSSPASIAAALDRGACYASTGPTIQRIAVEGQTIRLWHERAQVLAVRDIGGTLDMGERSQTEYVVGDADAYVRFELRTATGRAWTAAFTWER
jgi:hypothetical protein